MLTKARLLESTRRAAIYGGVISAAVMLVMFKRGLAAEHVVGVLPIALGAGAVSFVIALIAQLVFRASEENLYDPYNVRSLPTGFRKQTWWFLAVLVALIAAFAIWPDLLTGPPR